MDCAAGYSTTDPNLAPNDDPHLGGFVDKTADAPSTPANTLSFSLDLNACLDGTGVAWNPGDTIQMEIVARSQTAGDNSAQEVMFKRL